jgi:hypothetical protein
MERDIENEKLRYLAYVIRNFRHLAYTSDLGEAFRPIVFKNIIRASYVLMLFHLLM